MKERLSLLACAIHVAAAPLADAADRPDWMSPSHAAVVEQIKREDGKTALDILWTSRDVLAVGVLSNGTSRDGFAQYLCYTVLEHGFGGKDVTVKVLDVARLKRENDWTPIGRALCDRL